MTVDGTWEGYFLIWRIIDNLNEENWVSLMGLVKQIVGAGRNPNQVFRARGNLDTFEEVVGQDEEENDIVVVHSNAYIVAAHFQSGAVSFAKFKNRMINHFEVDEENVSYEVMHNELSDQKDRPSAVAEYTMGTHRISVMLFGCASDSQLCTKHESGEEMRHYIQMHKAVWEPV